MKTEAIARSDIISISSSHMLNAIPAQGFPSGFGRCSLIAKPNLPIAIGIGPIQPVDDLVRIA
jgi:hypothetical protein